MALPKKKEKISKTKAKIKKQKKKGKNEDGISNFKKECAEANSMKVKTLLVQV